MKKGLPVLTVGLAHWKEPSRNVATAIAEPLNQRWIMASFGHNTHSLYSEINPWI